MTLIESGAAAVASIKAAMKVAKALNNLEVQQQLIDAHERMLELIEQNQTLRDEVATLRDNADLRAQLVFRDNAYWLGEGESDANGPFCAGCFDGQGKLIHLNWAGRASGGFPITFCQNCKQNIYIRGRP